MRSCFALANFFSKAIMRRDGFVDCSSSSSESDQSLDASSSTEHQRLEAFKGKIRALYIRRRGSSSRTGIRYSSEDKNASVPLRFARDSGDGFYSRLCENINLENSSYLLTVLRIKLIRRIRPWKSRANTTSGTRCTVLL